MMEMKNEHQTELRAIKQERRDELAALKQELLKVIKATKQEQGDAKDDTSQQLELKGLQAGACMTSLQAA